MAVSTSTSNTSSLGSSASRQTLQSSNTRPKSYGSYKVDASADQVRAGSATLQRGQGGPAVEDLQRRLNAAGANPPLDVDGKMGPLTEGALKRYQAQNGLKSDGIFGKSSASALDGGTPFGCEEHHHHHTVGAEKQTHAPSHEQLRSRPEGTQRAGDLANAANVQRARVQSGGAFAPEPGRATGTFAGDRASREAQAESILKANGQWPPVEGRNYAIQIDQDAPPASASRADRLGHLRAYTGQTAVYRYEGGRLQETAGPMRSASHPGQASAGNSFTDVNGDNRSDIAHLRSGVYNYRSSPNGSGRLNPTDNRSMRVARDTNQDGAIDASEKQGDYYATALQWHAGRSNRPSSVGCQTMAPDDFSRFRGAVGQGDQRDFTYVLVRRPNDVHGENRL
jgi:peptidoglycan hydrolase-like protein with peptidoglycan-binding domain